MTAMKYWLWLAQLKDVPNQMKLTLLRYFTTPEKIFFGESGEYFLVEGMTREIASALEDKSLCEADQILGDCERLGLRILTLQDAEYPNRLRNIYDPPILLYVRGRLPLFDDEVTVAMVGTRKSSDYALRASEQIAYQLASHGAVVVSGLAAGGDAAAHRGALRANGFTAAVIGGGHDVIYPKENQFLYEDIAVRGVILSEYPPGTRHEGRHFPVRNRIISGLSLGVVVTEAPTRSGTLITANRALDQGRDVFAIPGRINDWHCEGSNRLLRDGAGVVTQAWDVLCHYVSQYPHKLHGRPVQEASRFGVESRTASNHNEAEAFARTVQEVSDCAETAAPSLPVLDLSKNEKLTDDQIAILKVLNGCDAMQVDDVIEQAQIPTRQVLAALTVLEIDGFVTRHSGKRFSLAVTLI
ncbi:MAG: DNA-processing protein DprA [Oscillospiraceae bacterium]|nr:DNA-processing protein DprA [Oscillospiraceae bacterium]